MRIQLGNIYSNLSKLFAHCLKEMFRNSNLCYLQSVLEKINHFERFYNNCFSFSPCFNIHQITQSWIEIVRLRLDNNFLIVSRSVCRSFISHEFLQIGIFIVHCRRCRNFLLAYSRSVGTTTIVGCRLFRARCVAMENIE